MGADIQVREDVQRELLYNPGINAAAIGVAVQDGVVTLMGTVDSYAQKLEAVRAAERIAQVRAVACELEVRLPGAYERTDTDLARAAANVLAWNISVPAERVRITVQNSWIVLEGTVDWQYQKDAAASAVTYLTGVQGVDNLIMVNPLAGAEDKKQQIEAALRRCATIEDRNIVVEVNHDLVALYGEVRSLPEREEAERIAWSAPGVCDVQNHLTVGEGILAGHRKQPVTRPPY